MTSAMVLRPATQTTKPIISTFILQIECMQASYAIDLEYAILNSTTDLYNNGINVPVGPPRTFLDAKNGC